MSPYDRRQRAELHRELEPNILPRHLLALERVAERLDAARPKPDARFRAELDERIEALAGDGGDAPTRWHVPAAAGAVLGLALLIVAAALAL